MFRLRIHSVDGHRRPATAAEIVASGGGGGHLYHSALSSSPSSSSGPFPSVAAGGGYPIVQVGRGVVHLFRDASPQHTSSSTFPSSSAADQQQHLPPLPAERGTLLFVLAVPSRLTPEDFLHFCCWSYSERLSEVRAIRNDAIEERYSMLIQFDEQKAADNFYLELNGWRFSSEEVLVEVCHILFLSSVEYTESTEIAGSPPTGCTELPSCPVCLERLDQDTSGIITTGCDHSFQCSCISKWANSSCLVCRFCMEHCEKPNCSVCETLENLWICMICGFVGCGRYKEGHAIKHWKDTQHCYSLDLQTQRVWDYVGDTYVHRLNQSKSDEKMAKFKNRHRSYDDHVWQCSEDPGYSGALLSSKVDAIVDEYNHLLANQLDTQREYYESLLLEAREKKEKVISEAVEKAIREKFQNIQVELENATEGKKSVTDMNEELLKNQNLLREKFKEVEDRERCMLKLKDEKIHDLEEEIRDITVYIQAQKTLNNVSFVEDIRGGTVLPVPLHQASSTRAKKSVKVGRRRH